MVNLKQEEGFFICFLLLLTRRQRTNELGMESGVEPTHSQPVICLQSRIPEITRKHLRMLPA